VFSNVWAGTKDHPFDLLPAGTTTNIGNDVGNLPTQTFATSPTTGLERDRRRWNHRRRESRGKRKSQSVIAEGGITEGVNHAGKERARACSP
jgi:hypothetical protein